jgi:hypothetical protein
MVVVRQCRVMHQNREHRVSLELAEEIMVEIHHLKHHHKAQRNKWINFFIVDYSFS